MASADKFVNLCTKYTSCKSSILKMHEKKVEDKENEMLKFRVLLLLFSNMILELDGTSSLCRFFNMYLHVDRLPQ